MSDPAAGPLPAALEEHRQALAGFVRQARGVSPERWHEPAAPGKWSPAEITEHLALSLQKLRRELSGETAMRMILAPWKRCALRWFILPSILRTGRFPRKVRAPREVRPADSRWPREEALGRLEAAYAEFEAASCEPSASGRRLTHPYFGRLSLARFHRLLARHAAHHGRQLPAGAEWR